jgi:hypothetical protein
LEKTNEINHLEKANEINHLEKANEIKGLEKGSTYHVLRGAPCSIQCQFQIFLRSAPIVRAVAKLVKCKLYQA